MQENPTSYQALATTPGGKSIGAALDSFNTTPPRALRDLLCLIDQSGAIGENLDQLSPQVYQEYGDIALAIMNFTTQAIDARLNNLHDGSEGIDTQGLGGTNGLTTGLVTQTNNDGKQTFSDGKDKEVASTAPDQKEWGFFAMGSGLFGDIDADKNAGRLSDADFTSWGILMGADTAKLGEHVIAGIYGEHNHHLGRSR